ncbi:MAG: hypothetical protein FWG10_14380 [Eubacteriaceae bacterium]|nr:hypothetical protein [Eubacteriaceae bacterium]
MHNFTQTAPERNFVPFAAYWDEHEQAQAPYMLPHVYDFVDGKDAAGKSGPAIEGWYGRRSYLTCYGKTQKTSFGSVVLERSGVPDDVDDEYMGIGSESVSFNGEGTAYYDFSLPAGSWDIAVCFVFPFFSSDRISFRLGGQTATISEGRQWWPYWRKTVWKKIGTVGTGSHTLEVTGAPLAQFYGFRACSSFSESAWCGEAEFTLSPKPFVDVNGAEVAPRSGFS